MLQSVELVNFLSHSKTRMEFDKGVTVFVGSNGAGKSSIIDAITFALFGQHTRKSTKDLLRKGTSQAYAKVEFSINGRQFEAVRKIDSKGTTSAQLNERVNGGLITIVAGERKQFGESMTQKIESFVGLDFGKLKVASLVQQGELQSIIDADPKKFKELVNAVIGIDKLDMAYDNMKKTIDAFRTAIRNEHGYDDSSVQTLQSKVSDISKEITLLEPQKMDLEQKIIVQSRELENLKQKVEADASKEFKMRELGNKREELSRYLKNVVSSIRRDLTEKERRISECSQSFEVLSSKSSIEAEIKHNQQEIERVRSESREIGEKMAKITGQQEIAIKLRLTDGKCPVCDSKVNRLNPLFEEEHLRFELEALKKRSGVLSAQENASLIKKKELDIKFQQIIRAESTLSSNNIKKLEDLEMLKKETSKLHDNLRNTPLEIQVTGNIMQFAIDKHSTDTINSISSLMEEVRGFDVSSFKELKNKMEQQRRIVSTLEQEIVAVDTKLQIKRDEHAKISKVLDVLIVVSNYITKLETIRSHIYNRDGPVASSLRSWALGIISQKASEYLSTFNVKIQRINLEDKTRDIIVRCHSGNSTLDLESLSGGEKVSIALALRLGMAHLLGSSNLNFIILDEPTNHLDHERRKSLVSVLSQAFESNIDAISQFIIITHDAEIFENSNIDTIYDFQSTPDGTIVRPI